MSQAFFKLITFCSPCSNLKLEVACDVCSNEKMESKGVGKERVNLGFMCYIQYILNTDLLLKNATFFNQSFCNIFLHN